MAIIINVVFSIRQLLNFRRVLDGKTLYRIIYIENIYIIPILNEHI